MGSYLVTGAAGFIGSEVTKRLIQNGHEVTTIDNVTTGYVDNVPKGVNFIRANCQDQEVYNKLKNTRFDAILHIAGQSSGEVSFDDPVYDLQTNTQSTLLILKYALKMGCKRVIYASSMSVYGDHTVLPVKEDALCTPKSFYAVGKLASEHYLRIYQQYGINTTALRLFNVYGPSQALGNLRQGMVRIYLTQSIENKHIIVKGSKERFRDFVYIDDVVDAFVQCIDDPNTFNDVFNIATGRKTTVGELLALIKDGLPFPIIWEFKGGTLGDQFGIYADISKARSRFGFSPRIPLKEGLNRMIDWSLRWKSQHGDAKV